MKVTLRLCVRVCVRNFAELISPDRSLRGLYLYFLIERSEPPVQY